MTKLFLGSNTRPNSFSAVLRIVGCVSVTKSEATNSYEVNAVHDNPPVFCGVLPEKELNAGEPYTMTVELMNVIGSGRVNYGHPAVMYNVIDQNNFDFVFFRLHNRNCYQLGYVLNGNVFTTVTASCPNGNPSGGVWFTLRVEVSSDGSVNIYLNNDLMTSPTAHFNAKGRGGVLVLNGYENIIQFRKIHLNRH
ncbi:hypothetical protein OS493_020111 [Desmophyllum pertusum]|uniref:3-keto-disaccharide hydrolase domain-containing protein n=1 Tax=Desmophyllum pertusum TaxID=174260 RepID=A0A9X0A1E5_9CNID|nr:hypothetical protein OS493_020111 [Desmophyllum pertusum]